MSYTPGTMFRAFTEDKSKHYTAVLLKDGKVLEVKNPDTITKTTFDTLELWKATHSHCSVETDTSKGSGVIIGSDTNGFNYPRQALKAYTWIQWCYSMVKEAAPQLLNSDEFKTAYNKMVEVCDKHKQELQCGWSTWSRFQKEYRYSVLNILWSTDEHPYNSRWCGFPGFFPNESHYNYTVKNTGYSKEEYENARKEILEAYKTVLDIIKPHIETHMAKKHKICETKKKIAYAKRMMKLTQSRVIKLQTKIHSLKTTFHIETDKLKKMEEEADDPTGVHA